MYYLTPKHKEFLSEDCKIHNNNFKINYEFSAKRINLFL